MLRSFGEKIRLLLVRWHETPKWWNSVLNTLRGDYVVVIILLLAVFVRLAHAKAVFYSPISDMRAYLNLARDLFSSAGVSNAMWTCFFPPGYPWWLILCSRILGFTSLKSILYLQALVSGIAVLPLFHATTKLFSRQAGLATGFIYSVYLPYIYASGLLLSEVLAISLLILFIWFFSQGLKGLSYRWIVAGALTLAAAVHVRTNLLPLALPAGVMIFLQARFSDKAHNLRCLALGLLFYVVLGVSLVPWSLRNTLVTGKVMFLAANSGMNLYQGNNPISSGGWPDFGSAKSIYQEFIPTSPHPVERDKQ